MTTIQRKLSMRKSNGSIIESTEDDSSNQMSESSSDPDRVTTSKIYQFIYATNYYFNAYSKSLNELIQIKVVKDDGKHHNDEIHHIIDYNTIEMRNTELILRRIQPYHSYTVIFHLRDNESNVKKWMRTMQIVPIDGENQERCQINKGWISSITAFNIFSNKILSGDKDIKAEIDLSSNHSDIQVAKEIKLSLITHSNSKDRDHTDLKLLLKNFFSRNKLVYNNDVIELTTDDNDKIHYEITKINNNNEQNLPYYVNQSTIIYQLPKKRRVYPRNINKKSEEFLPKSYCNVEERVRKLVLQNIDGASTVEDSLILVISSSVLSDIEKLVEKLADNVGVDVIHIDCLNFWNIEGKSSNKLIDDVIDEAKISSPSLVIFDNIVSLNDTSPNNLELGNKTLDYLTTKIKSLSKYKLPIIFTCEKMNLPNLPKSITNLIHFEFILPEITTNDRHDFIDFYQKNYSKQINLTVDDFINQTRGFLLSELEQLLVDASNLSIFDGLPYITEDHIKASIDKRNKSFSDSIGAPKIPTVKWDDVGGLDDVKKIISESLKMNLKPTDKNKNLKRSGIVLYGPPGCGKTLMAKAVANEFNITFLSVKGPELLNQYVGQSEQNLRLIFEKARLASPSIIFFDEIDSLAPNRGAAGDSGGVMDRMVSQLLAELDTLHSKQNCEVFIMAATNRPDLLDPCLLTPGRFDKSVHVKPANDIVSKTRILEPLCKKICLEDVLSPEEIAKMCPDTVSGADLSSVIQKSTMNALREVILELERKNLKGDKEADLINETEIVIRRDHVELALREIGSQ